MFFHSINNDSEINEFIWWAINQYVPNIYTKRWSHRKTMRTYTTNELYNIWTMENNFRIHNWYTCNFGLSKVTFYCEAEDGEYLFPTENINKEGYSKLLCRPATNEEILSACYSPRL